MSTPYEPKEAAYQHHCGDRSDPEGPYLADLRDRYQHQEASIWKQTSGSKHLFVMLERVHHVCLLLGTLVACL